MKNVHKSMWRKDDELENSADFVIESRGICGTKNVNDSQVDFSELFSSLKQD